LLSLVLSDLFGVLLKDLLRELDISFLPIPFVALSTFPAAVTPAAVTATSFANS
jgi:hypothetical protein